MAAPNKQPAGSRPGPASVHEHGPHSGGKPASGAEAGNAKGKGSGTTRPSTPKPVGKGKSNPLH